MTDETLSSELKYAEKGSNFLDYASPITTWNVPEGTSLTLEQGHAAIVDIGDGAGGDISRGSRVGLAYREPNAPLDAWTVFADFSIAPFNSLSLKDQQSGDNAQRRRVRFDPEVVPNGSITLQDADEVALMLLSPDGISASDVFFNYPMSVSND